MCVLAERPAVSFVFSQQIPAGQYSLKLADSGGLKDLAGQSLVGSGASADVLATWSVSSRVRPALPNDLGVVWPSEIDGIPQSATIAPGQTNVYRVVIPVAGLYTLQTRLQGGSLDVQRLGKDGLVVLDRNAKAPVTNYVMDLKAGVYLISMTSVGTQSARFTGR